MGRTDADALADLARRLSAQPGLDAVWTCVLHAVVTQVGGAEHVGITLLSRTSVSTPAATSDLVRQVDEHQYVTGEGPCLTAAQQGEPVVRVENLSTDHRWPQFREAAVDLGVRSMLSYRLFTEAGTIGALNVYAASAKAFSDDAVHTGALLATHAAVAAAASITNGHLRAALESRDTIGQAKGILMHRHGITAEQAFDLLVRASQTAHRKLRDVAADLVTTRELPTGHDR